MCYMNKLDYKYSSKYKQVIGATLLVVGVMQSDSSWYDWPAVSLLPTLWLYQPAADGAAKGSYCLILWVRGVDHNWFYPSERFSLAHLLKGVQRIVQNWAGLLTSLLRLFLSLQSTAHWRSNTCKRRPNQILNAKKSTYFTMKGCTFLFKISYVLNPMYYLHFLRHYINCFFKPLLLKLQESGWNI